MIGEIIEQLEHCVVQPESRRTIFGLATRLVELSPTETRELFDRLLQFAEETDNALWPELLAVLLGPYTATSENRWPTAEALQPIAELYQRCPADSILRNELLALIAKSSDPQAKDVWSRLLCDDPPQTAAALGIAFRPMLADDCQIPIGLLTGLIHRATGNLYVAAAVYELANHAFRTGKVLSHPASNRCEALRGLLGGLVGQLSRIEEGQLPSDVSAESLAETVSNSVALIIALIDTFALLDDERSIGKLNQAMALRHRRIQVEAAAALAKFGDENGKRQLIESAQHPVVRLRVISYAEELGLANEISLEHTGPIATAESHLAMWLAEPGQMGLAPSRMNLIDQREWYWPSFEKPVACLLFEFEYGADKQSYRNVGICGPLTHAFAADLRPISTSDQYAAFAGWQTTSTEIFLVPIERAETLMAGPTDHLKRALGRESLENYAIHAVSVFFGNHALVATGLRGTESGTLIVDDVGTEWIPRGNPASPIDWILALNIWRGRRLLASFNPTTDLSSRNFPGSR